MPASYPTSAKTFATITNNDTSDASQINEPREEITAIEQDLIAGLPVARGGTGATSLTANRVPYVNAGGTALTSAAGLTFDGTTLTAPATTITQPLTISGAAAGQIVFPAAQNPSTNANTLDDYEEGTWTPAIGGSGGQSGQVYSVQVGSYIKIGKLVTASFFVNLSTLGTITTNVQVQGLPFTSQNTTNMIAAATIGLWSGMTSSFVYITGLLSENATAINIFGATAAATALTNLAQGNLSDTSRFLGTITYRAEN